MKPSVCSQRSNTLKKKVDVMYCVCIDMDCAYMEGVVLRVMDLMY